METTSGPHYYGILDLRKNGLLGMLGNNWPNLGLRVGRLADTVDSGQSCCAIERVYVHQKVYDGFITEVKKVLSNYRFLYGILDLRKNGLLGMLGNNWPNLGLRVGRLADTPNGNYVRPTLLTGANHDMAVMKDETFGPVIPVMKQPAARPPQHPCSKHWR
jgi:hypothetical protein